MATQRPKLFYGWTIVAVAFIAGAFSSGVGFWSITVFAKPMQDELGWSRLLIFGVMTLRALMGGVLAPFLGPWMDKKGGARVLALGSTLLLGVALIGLKFTSEWWHLYLLFGILGSVATVVGGANIGEIVLPKWFIRKRAHVLGLSSMGSAMGPLLFPVPMRLAIDFFGWRDAWLAMGILTILVMAPLCLLIRTQPEDIGLLPDGATRKAVPAGGQATASEWQEEESFTHREAARTGAFWLMLASFSIISLTVGGFQNNWPLYLQDEGFSQDFTALAITFYGVGSFTARILWGSLSARYALRYVLIAQTFMTGSVIILMFFIRSGPVLLGYMLLQGLMLGGFWLLQPLIVADYFGRGHLGAVRGIMRPFTTVASAISPLLIAGLYGWQGSYVTAFVLSIATWFIGGAVLYAAAPPKRRVPTVIVTTVPAAGMHPLASQEKPG